jgi:hypothetical protein
MDKRMYMAGGILVWAGALQVHMWSLTSSDDFKQSQISKAGDEAQSWSVSFSGLFGGNNAAQQKKSGGGGDDEGR